MSMRTFRAGELARYNGRNGSPCFVAYLGTVYDVSRSFLWQKGSHQMEHIAGADLTGELGEAPHGPEMLLKFPVVGVLVE